MSDARASREGDVQSCRERSEMVCDRLNGPRDQRQDDRRNHTPRRGELREARHEVRELRTQAATRRGRLVGFMASPRPTHDDNDRDDDRGQDQDRDRFAATHNRWHDDDERRRDQQRDIGGDFHQPIDGQRRERSRRGNHRSPSDEQRAVAAAYLEQLAGSGKWRRPIVTRLERAQAHFN